MAQQFVQTKIKGDKVVLFMKPTCSYCIMAKDVLSKYKFKPGHLEYIDISGRSDMDSMQDYFLELTGARTVVQEQNLLTRTFQSGAVELGVDSLILGGEITAINPANVKESDKGALGCVPDYYRTVPRVFIGEECVGGGSDVAELHQTGKLQGMLQSIGALQ